MVKISITDLIRITCDDQDSCWQFSVIDNGPGIAPKNYEKIFRVFQKLESRNFIESTGIGLSIVKKIVALFGGKIWVESELGEGSRFIFTLPKKHTISDNEFD